MSVARGGGGRRGRRSASGRTEPSVERVEALAAAELLEPIYRRQDAPSKLAAALEVLQGVLASRRTLVVAAADLEPAASFVRQVDEVVGLQQHVVKLDETQPILRIKTHFVAFRL